MSSGLRVNTSSDRVLITSRAAFSTAMPGEICTLWTLWLSDISKYLMAAECLNIELYISFVWQSSQNPLGAGLLLRAHLLRFLGVIIMPPIGYELIRNRPRNPTDGDQKVILLFSKHRFESRTLTLSTISLPTDPHLNEFIWHGQIQRSRTIESIPLSKILRVSYSQFHTEKFTNHQDKIGFPEIEKRKLSSFSSLSLPIQ